MLGILFYVDLAVISAWVSTPLPGCPGKREGRPGKRVGPRVNGYLPRRMRELFRDGRNLLAAISTWVAIPLHGVPGKMVGLAIFPGPT